MKKWQSCSLHIYLALKFSSNRGDKHVVAIEHIQHLLKYIYNFFYQVVMITVICEMLHCLSVYYTMSDLIDH